MSFTAESNTTLRWHFLSWKAHWISLEFSQLSFLLVGTLCSHHVFNFLQLFISSDILSSCHISSCLKLLNLLLFGPWPDCSSNPLHCCHAAVLNSEVWSFYLPAQPLSPPSYGEQVPPSSSVLVGEQSHLYTTEAEDPQGPVPASWNPGPTPLSGLAQADTPPRTWNLESLLQGNRPVVTAVGAWEQ